MTVTVAQFREYVGTKEESVFVTDALDAGKSLVARYVGPVVGVPSHIIDQSVLICASELFHRRQSPGGVTQFADMSGSAVRVGRDPMFAAYELLRPWCQFAV
jgi:uncharacterized membrane protein